MTRPADSKLNFAIFGNFIRSRWSAGYWQEALEWDVWQLADSSDEADGEPLANRANNWHHKISDLIHRINYLGYHEEALALCERALSAKHDGWYHGRHPIQHERSWLSIMMDLDRPVPDLVERLEELVLRAEGNMYMTRSGCTMEVTLARALLKTGRIREGEDLLGRLVDEGIFSARLQRMTHWLEIGRVEGVEEELIEESESGVSSAVIEAGEFRLNPFYGVPIHHHYSATEPGEYSLPMRFVTSAPARVEIYDLNGGLLAIDSQGNGSLHDRGDELYGTSDGKGNLRLAHADQNAAFMVLLYPQAPLGEEGLSMRIEALDDGNWVLFAEDRLK